MFTVASCGAMSPPRLRCIRHGCDLKLRLDCTIASFYVKLSTSHPRTIVAR